MGAERAHAHRCPAALPPLGYLYTTHPVFTNPHPFTDQQFEKLLGLYAYGFHVYRSTCHKPNYVDISLAQLVNYVASNPALKPVIASSSSVSLLGRHGADIAPDKACEWVNDFITSDR